jgi:hypothetical protein
VCTVIMYRVKSIIMSFLLLMPRITTVIKHHYLDVGCGSLTASLALVYIR